MGIVNTSAATTPVAESRGFPLQGEKIYTTRSTCRMCGGSQLEKVWAFGESPLANAYLKVNEVDRPEPFAPLDVYYCKSCHLVQLLDIVDPKVLFSHYHYVSSTSASFRKHFEEYAEHVMQKLKLDSNSLVVDVGSNDGILLKPLKERGVGILGIDPALNIAAMANADGIETIAAFFTPEVAKGVAEKYGKADVITANNVFAHTDDVDLFTRATKELLTEDGVFIFEVQYLGDLIEKNLFDIVYHEHVCYYHMSPLVEFFAKNDLDVFDAERLPVHGGSIRVYVQRSSGPHAHTSRLQDILKSEKELNTIEPYTLFAKRIEDNKKKLHQIIQDIQNEGKRIVGYGAPAKATTLMCAFGLDASHIEYIVDDDAKIKQGMLMPGTHIPIVSPDRLYEDRPDYCLILAWNFADVIMENHENYAKIGGKFIVPVPTPSVL